MGLINVREVGNLKIIDNSMQIVAGYQSLRLDAFFYENMEKAEDFFNRDIRWVKLGSLINEISNGENLSTEWYSVDGDSKVVYLSVSQVTEFGLEDKNTSYLKEEILEETFGKSQRKISLIGKEMIIVTRSGTPGIALCTNHPSFDYDEYEYVPSGFLIYFNLLPNLNINPNIITYYMNLRPVRYYLIANSSGRCQRNISQEILMDLPIPEDIINTEKQIEILKLYGEIERKSVKANIVINKIKTQLENIWDESWERFTQLL